MTKAAVASLVALTACSSEPPLLCDDSLPGDRVLLALPRSAFGSAASGIVEVCVDVTCTDRQEVTQGSTAAFAKPNFLPESGNLRLVLGPPGGPSQVILVDVTSEAFEPKGAGCGTARRLGLRLADDGRTASQVPFSDLHE